MVEHLSWIQVLSGFGKAAIDRAALWVGRRKPRAFVHVRPGTSVWCVAKQQNPQVEYMQIVCTTNVTHDDPKLALVFLDAYPKGTTTQVPLFQAFAVAPKTIANEQIAAIVSPIVGKKGKPWTGKLVLVDQFKRKYKTDKITFQWTGPA
jgi:hypothetical protein